MPILIDQQTGMKVDVFVAGGTPLDDAALNRRLPFSPRAGAGTLYVHTPEDVLLQKLRWYRKGGKSRIANGGTWSASCACRGHGSTARISTTARGCSV